MNCKKINQKSAKVMVRKRQKKQKWFIGKLCCFHPLTCFCIWTMNTYTRNVCYRNNEFDEKSILNYCCFFALCYTMYRYSFLIFKLSTHYIQRSLVSTFYFCHNFFLIWLNFPGRVYLCVCMFKYILIYIHMIMTVPTKCLTCNKFSSLSIIQMRRINFSLI